MTRAGDIQLVTGSTPQPNRWPRNASDVGVWLPYAVETLANTEANELLSAMDHLSRYRFNLVSLPEDTKRGVAGTTGWLLTWLPFPTLSRNSAGQWMLPGPAARLLIEAGVLTYDTHALFELVDTLHAIKGAAPRLPIRVSLSEVLAVHAAGFTAATVSAHAEQDGRIERIRNWVQAGFTGNQWELAHRARLSPTEVDEIVTSRVFPDEQTLQMLAAFNHGS